MKIEKLGRNRKKKIVIGVVVFLCLLSAIIYTGSRAKYRVTQSIPLVNGIINYKPYDFKMMAMYQANENGEYTEINAMPTSGYAINEEKSYCTTDNVNKDTTAKLFTNSQGQHVIENLKKNDKCYIWFDVKKLTVQDLIASHNPTAGSTSFTGISTSNEGLKSGEDDDGTTYYFRGVVDNNWVQFAGFYWRIIRINGDGSMRLIYNGSSITTTGTETQIGTSKYSHNDGTTSNAAYLKDNTYVGYMYGTAGASTYAAAHSNSTSSAIKTSLDTWYKTNIVDKGYGNKISTDAGFCNDRKVDKSVASMYQQGDGYGAKPTGYAPWGRLFTNGAWKTSQTPSFKCTNASNDLFTSPTSTKGNKKLTYPVGLITSDEIVFAGSFGVNGVNSSYYLYTNQGYWTMSPSLVDALGWARVFYVDYSGQLTEGTVTNTLGVRPVINLSSDVKLTGTGTTSDPYKVV